jgi:hypothetical protein
VGRAEGSNAGADAAAAETPAEPPIDQPSAALSGHGIRRLNPGRLIKKLARAVHRPKTEARAGERSNGVF